MTNLIVFDLDGTLVDTAPDLLGALNVALAAEGLAPVTLDIARSLVGAGVRALVERGLKHHARNVPDSRIDALMTVFLDHYTAHIADHSRPYPGVIDSLLDLQSQGWRFAICTNKLELYSVKLIRELKMSHWFAANCGGDTFPFRKPDRRHLIETIARAGGGNAIMVGDSQTDVDTARGAGIPVIGVSFGYTDIPMKDLKPDVLIDHFDQLAEAVHRLT